MYRFFVSPKQVMEDQILITGDDVNHMKNVLRMKPGEEIRISDGQEMEYFCHVITLSEDEVCVGIDRREAFTTELPVEIILYQGLPKGDKMELIIQKAVELGVSRVVPVAMKRCVMKLDEKKAANKVKRWNAIAEAAAKQSKRSVIPEVSMPLTWKQMLGESSGVTWKLLPYECADGMASVRRILGEIAQSLDKMQAGQERTKVAILIGPEGGFEESEVAQAEEDGWQCVSLGSRILRTETAGMCLLSMMTYVLEP